MYWYNEQQSLTLDQRQEEKRAISNKLIHSEDTSTTVGSAANPELEISAVSSVEEEDLLDDEEAGQGPQVGIGIFRFRFSLVNFRLGREISERRFSIAEAAALLMMAYIASRGLGVIRQSIFNAAFGTSAAANAYYAASRMPDFLFNLIAGGALSNALIPVFISFDKDHGRQVAWRLVSLVFNVMLVALVLVLLAGEFFAPAFVAHFLVPGYSAPVQELTTSLTRVMLVQPLILGLGTVATAVLSSKRQFLLPALSIAVYNFGLIGGLLFTLAIPGVGIYGPTYGVLAAAAFQVVVQIPGLVKQGLRYSFVWDIRDAGLRQVMRLLGPNAVIVFIGSTSFIIDTAFASYLPDQASLSAQHNAYLLYNLPVALMAQAIAQAALPQLSALVARGHFGRLRGLVLKLVGGALMLGIPTMLALCVLSMPLIHIIFQHGAFDKHSSDLTSLALIGYALGLPGVIVGELLARTFYAMKDALTPLFTNIFNVAAHIGLILFLLTICTGTNAILAIPLATTGSATAEALLLCLVMFLRLRKKIANERELRLAGAAQ